MIRYVHEEHTFVKWVIEHTMYSIYCLTNTIVNICIYIQSLLLKNYSDISYNFLHERITEYILSANDVISLPSQS